MENDYGLDADVFEHKYREAGFHRYDLQMVKSIAKDRGFQEIGYHDEYALVSFLQDSPNQAFSELQIEVYYESDSCFIIAELPELGRLKVLRTGIGTHELFDLMRKPRDSIGLGLYTGPLNMVTGKDVLNVSETDARFQVNGAYGAVFGEQRFLDDHGVLGDLVGEGYRALALTRRGFVFVRENGQIITHGRDIPKRLLDVIRKVELTNDRIDVLAIGTGDRFYVRCQSGVQYAFGSDDFIEILTNEEAVSRVHHVAFGPEFDSWVVIREDGSVAFEGVHDRLGSVLSDKRIMPILSSVALSPDRSSVFCVFFSNGRTVLNSVPREVKEAHSKYGIRSGFIGYREIDSKKPPPFVLGMERGEGEEKEMNNDEQWCDALLSHDAAAANRAECRQERTSGSI